MMEQFTRAVSQFSKALFFPKLEAIHSATVTEVPEDWRKIRLQGRDNKESG